MRVDSPNRMGNPKGNSCLRTPGPGNCILIAFTAIPTTYRDINIVRFPKFVATGVLMFFISMKQTLAVRSNYRNSSQPKADHRVDQQLGHVHQTLKVNSVFFQVLLILPSCGRTRAHKIGTFAIVRKSENQSSLWLSERKVSYHG